MAKIQLPNVALGIFVKTAQAWLSKSADAKSGNLEVRIANQEGDLHVSAGADSSYLEALLECPAGALEALKAPLFLDLPTLAAYSFDEDGLSMVVPEVEKADQRINFSAQGFSFRIPRKTGNSWERNSFDLTKLPAKLAQVDMSQDLFVKFNKHRNLPDSHKSDRSFYQITLDVKPGRQLEMFAYDGFGAFHHVFKDVMVVGTEGRFSILEDFLTPTKKLPLENGISLSVTEAQACGALLNPGFGFKSFQWTQPRYTGRGEDVPLALTTSRKIMTGVASLNPKTFSKNLEKVNMLLTPAEKRDRAVAMSFVGSQYSLKTYKASGEEVEVTDSVLAPPDSNIKLNVQCQCFVDYVSEFDCSGDVGLYLEMLKDTVYFYQNTENTYLSYWAPTIQGRG